MHWARCLSRRTEQGRAYGEITAKAVAVLEALLWTFHNARSGLCFPSYERIAEAAHCARSTVAEAIKALEDAGVLSWVQRIKRVREAAPGQVSDCHGPGREGRGPGKTASARFRPLDRRSTGGWSGARSQRRWLMRRGGPRRGLTAYASRAGPSAALSVRWRRSRLAMRQRIGAVRAGARHGH
jgi:hypothetical protein